MDRDQPRGRSSQLDRSLAHLKILSRLLGHELAAQTGQRIALSRDQIEEVQTSIDLFIESFVQQRGSSNGFEMDVQPARPTQIN